MGHSDSKPRITQHPHQPLGTDVGTPMVTNDPVRRAKINQFPADIMSDIFIKQATFSAFAQRQAYTTDDYPRVIPE